MQKQALEGAPRALYQAEKKARELWLLGDPLKHGVMTPATRPCKQKGHLQQEGHGKAHGLIPVVPTCTHFIH